MRYEGHVYTVCGLKKNIIFSAKTWEEDDTPLSIFSLFLDALFLFMLNENIRVGWL